MSEKKKRAWWQKKTTWGTICTAIGLGLSTTPFSMAVLAGKIIVAVAMPFSLYAVSDRIERDKKEE